MTTNPHAPMTPEYRAWQDEARKQQTARYRRLANYAHECRTKAANARSVDDAMRLVRAADDFAARAYHEIA